MAHAESKRTANYKLPQWEASDKPDRTDFNYGFAQVDAALGNKANVGSPQEYDLPVTSDYTCYVKYSKDQYGKVMLEGNLNRNSGYLTSEDIVATLPVGYRPRMQRQFQIGLYASGGSIHYSGLATIKTTGEISIGHSGANINFVYLGFTFLAQ